MSTMVFLMALRRMGRNDITPHGFRSSFRDWAEERTQFKPSVIEAALAHKVADKVEAAYGRTKLFVNFRALSPIRFSRSIPHPPLTRYRFSFFQNS